MPKTKREERLEDESETQNKEKQPKTENSEHKPNNEVRLGLPHTNQTTAHSSQHSVGGTSTSNITNPRSISRELVYPFKRDINVNLVVKNGEYNLKLTSVPTDDKMTNHAHTAAMLLSQGEFLRKLGHKLLSEFGAHYESETYTTLDL